jgi:hypothetical protein
MSVRKRKWVTSKGEGRTAWVVDYVDQDGARAIKTFVLKKDADEYHATVKVDVRHGVISRRQTTRWLRLRALDASAKGGGGERTIRRYRQQICAHRAAHRLHQACAPDATASGRSAIECCRSATDGAKVLTDMSRAQGGEARASGGGRVVGRDRRGERGSKRAATALRRRSAAHSLAGIDIKRGRCSSW